MKSKLWLWIFAVWFTFLSGVFSQFVGTPGVLQALRLNTLLQDKQSAITQLESQVHKLQVEGTLVEKSRSVQEREIRRVLGYAAADEIIFDFTRSE